jgi:uncharacterized protein YgbK (DUF1537 family)
LVVLDDDPTGTQAVHDVPVLTDWQVDDFQWAFAQIENTDAPPAVFVETNSRSLDPHSAREINAAVITNAVAAARQKGVSVSFASRSDSTLRGHYPLEPDVISETLAKLGEPAVDGVLLVPAFPEAGRVTIAGIHSVREAAGKLVPVGESEFAKDATFGYSSSRLADYAAEKSAGQWRSHDVLALDLNAIRSGTAEIVDVLRQATGGAPIAVDVVNEDDLLALALGMLTAQAQGKTLLPRSGPSFIRALIAQRQRPPLTAAEIFSHIGESAPGGLIVVGSHVGVSTRQLAQLKAQSPSLVEIEIRVANLLGDADRGPALAQIASQIVQALKTGNVVVYTSRDLVKGDNPAASLDIARKISRELYSITALVVDQTRPRFVIAKGGITSSDLARFGMRMRRAVVRGCLLPGIVSLWQGQDGPGAGIPYVVFAGNVGDDFALSNVVNLLSANRS